MTVLAVFKYYNFFVESFINLFEVGRGDSAFLTLEIVLPVGISFYVFQTLTYVVDVYKGKITSRPTLLIYFSYVAFFPQLVAGPIERAKNLLPQFGEIKKFRYDDLLIGGCLIIVGLFLKLYVADPLGQISDKIFLDSSDYNSGERILGIVYFSGQIYGDFCGYSTVAIGLARILGFRLMINFRTPYFSSSVSDFWRRWHISLSSFFRDYIYIPLGGSRSGWIICIVATMVTFLLSGLWHGAAWGFVLWGGLHGFFVVLEKYIPWSFSTPNSNRILSAVAVGACSTYTLVVVGILWVFFRLPNIDEAFSYLEIFRVGLELPQKERFGLLVLPLLLAVDLFWRTDPLLESKFSRRSFFSEIFLAFLLCFVITGVLNSGDNNAFIYFQF